MSTLNRNSEYEQIGELHVQTIKSQSQDDAELNLHGYAHATARMVLFHVVAVLLLGVPYAVIAWYPSCGVWRYRKCSLSTAGLVLVSDNFGNDILVEIKTESIDLASMACTMLRYFTYQHTHYVWIPYKSAFGTLDEFMPELTLEQILKDSKGLDEQEEQKLLQVYGKNKIEVKVKTYWRLFVEEVFNPFYLFQLFSVVLWYFDEYRIYAGCVVVLTTFSITSALYETRKQSEALHSLVENSTHPGAVQIIKGSLPDHSSSEDTKLLPPVTIEPTELVPGHILLIPRTGCTMPCDAVLLTGNVIVNESMLTGESVPVMKTPPPETDEVYSATRHKAHTLFSGTEVLQGRFYGVEFITARVVQTGFNTTKGALVKSIMFPTPVGFKFYKDSMKFLACLFGVASIGMVYCIYLYAMRDAEIREMVIRALDIITIVVPPAMPAAMTVGIVYSQSRLRKLQIFCISPPRIPICGKIKLACFDKTGTLTHEGLDLYSVLPCEKANFTEPVEDVAIIDVHEPIIQAMATCHSLTRIDGEINGDPLDINMFECTKWLLEEPGDEDTNYDVLAPTVVKPDVKFKYQSPSARAKAEFLGDLDDVYEIGIIKQFQFASNLQRMSVICRVLGARNMLIFSKGAPEKIESMCLAETIPEDFSRKLAEFTAQGFRVIAFAYKELPTKFKWKDAQKVKREQVECDLTFLGFIVMQNTLKDETTPVISALHSANIRTIMITGDNVMTAICVARECGMIGINDDVLLLQLREVEGQQTPEIYGEYVGNTNTAAEQISVVNITEDNYKFAMVGDTWSKLREYYRKDLPYILLKATVFARFQPDQKTQLVKALQDLDYIVSMVGDGANDCGALKAAHVGVSLSQAEASVAAPFTSGIENISCLIHLILEGRCALVTSFAVFKYMALYSLIQFFTIIILYRLNSILGDQQFLFIDLIITTSLAVTIGRQGPSNILVPKRPMGSLMSGTNLVPMVLQIFFCAFIQYAGLCYLRMQSWYTPNPMERDEIVICWENTVLFTVSSFQYVILAVVYSKGEPYRENVISNFWLLVCSLALTCFTTYLCICPSREVAEFFEVQYLEPTKDRQVHLFRDTLLFFPIAHYIIAVAVESFIGESEWLKRIVHFVTCKRSPKNRYKAIAAKSTEFYCEIVDYNRDADC